MFDEIQEDFMIHLKLERGLSALSYQAYGRDIRRFLNYISTDPEGFQELTQIQEEHVLRFLKDLTELGIEPSSQARMISSLRAFFQFLIEEKKLEKDPVIHIKTPKLGRKLPATLSFEEIVKILEMNDLSTNEGLRNRAMLEILYGSGLRVSELVNLKFSDIYEDMSFVKVRGRGIRSDLYRWERMRVIF